VYLSTGTIVYLKCISRRFLSRVPLCVRKAHLKLSVKDDKSHATGTASVMVAARGANARARFSRHGCLRFCVGNPNEHQTFPFGVVCVRPDRSAVGLWLPPALQQFEQLRAAATLLR
jgi:hypothetical protein